jgi:hypothetical protein
MANVSKEGPGYEDSTQHQEGPTAYTGNIERLIVNYMKRQRPE